MLAGWFYENDEETFDKWLVRDGDSDNGDIVAIVPKTGDEEFDSEVVWPRAALISAAPDMRDALLEVLEQGFVQCNCGSECEGTCTYAKCLSSVTKARHTPVLPLPRWSRWLKSILRRIR